MSPVCLVQGASRGIGLQFCKTLLRRSTDSVVIATCRNPNSAESLQKLKVEHPDSLHVYQVDVTKETEIRDASVEIGDRFEKIDLLINSAGILHPSGRGETSLKDVSSEGILNTLSVNTVGPLLMGKYFSSMMTRGDGVFGIQDEDAKKRHAAILVNISAKVGSITDNGLGGWYSYRMSKAALNMATKNLSLELGRGRNRVICVSLHPGTVDTDLSRPYHKNVPNLFPTEHSVDCLLAVVDSLRIADTGKFFTYDRKEMPY